MFEQYSERARRVVFLSRKVAGRRGAAEIGVEDLMESLVVEDQGDLRRCFPKSGRLVQPCSGWGNISRFSPKKLRQPYIAVWKRCWRRRVRRLRIQPICR